MRIVVSGARAGGKIALVSALVTVVPGFVDRLAVSAERLVELPAGSRVVADARGAQRHPTSGS